MTSKKKDEVKEKKPANNSKPSEIKNIAVMCSGGDSPGMNPVIRAVVRTALGKGLGVYGIQKGYAGILEGNFREMTASSVGNIIQHGGTMLQTSRCLEFHNPEIRTEAAHILTRKKIDALVVIGGNGSFAGANLLSQEHKIPIIGVPGTIDNDISGTEYSIGFDTAIQTAVEAVDKIRDTAHSHERTFIVEVMGRKSPGIALHVGVCSGAENIVFPTDKEIDYDHIASDIKRGIERGKKSSVIIVAEGETPGLCYKIQDNLKKSFQIESHVCILGHIQRGGNPSALDRFRASSMGYRSVMALLDGVTSGVTAFNKGRVEIVPFTDCLGKKEEYEKPFLDLVHTLAI